MANSMIFGHHLEELTDGVTVFREGLGKPMPLLSTAINIEIFSGLAVVVITRKFLNKEDVPIEAILTMPVGFNAAVTGLFASIDGRKLRAIAKPKDEARDIYEDSIDEGTTAVLHEEAIRGIHVLSIGQLAPSKEVEVELRMVVPLAMSGAGPFLRIPMTAGQLYGSTPLRPADDLIADAHVGHVATLKVRADSGTPKLFGKGPIDPEAVINVSLDRAIELVVKGGRFGTVTGVSAEGHQVRVDLRPQRIGETNLKLAVLVDRSGSTSSSLGDGTETVLSAMRHGLTTALSEVKNDDHIAVWQFNDECQRLGTGQGTEILQILQKLNKPGGGTKLGAAIKKVAASGIQDILVLTDGQTWDIDPCLAAELNTRVSAVLVGKASLDANIGHLCTETGGDLFYAPDAEVGSCVRDALNSKRSSTVLRDIKLLEGRPIQVRRIAGGVEIVASWSAAMEVSTGSDIGRFAASLCLGQMEENAATCLALTEGLCSQVTSLILVDEAGETSNGLSETRKVPLMMEAASFMPISSLQANSEPRMRLKKRVSAPDATKMQMALRSETQAQQRRHMADFVNPRLMAPRKLRSFLDGDAYADPASKPRGRFSLQKLASLAEGIDWDTQSNRFLSGDFTGLLPEEEAYLDALTADEAIADTVQKVPLNPKLILLSWLARRFVTHSRAAERFANKVLDQITGCDITAKIEIQIIALNTEGN